jgi:hypothetical protein
MNQPNLPNAPWLGESAIAQWELWRAGIEWAAQTGWFVPAPSSFPMPIEPPSQSREESDRL